MSMFDMPQSAFDALNDAYLDTPADGAVCDCCRRWVIRYAIVQVGDGLIEFCCPACYVQSSRTGHYSRETMEDVEWNR